MTTADEAIAYIEQGTPAFRRTSAALFLAGFSTFGLLYCVQPLLPEFSRHFGVSAASSALALSVTTALLAVTMLLAGVLSDVVGRRPLMIASLLLSSLLALASALVDDWAVLLLLRTLLGITLSGVPAVAMTYLVEEMDSRSLGLAMGLYIGGNAVGGMSGRLLAGIVADHWGWRMGIGSVALIALLGTLLLWSQLPPSRHFLRRRANLLQMPARFAQLLRAPALSGLFVIGFVLLGVFVTLYNYLGFHLLAPPYSLSQTVVGLIFMLYLLGSVSSTWMGQWATRLGRGRVLLLSFGLIGVGIALLALPWLPAMIVGIALVTFGFFGGHSVASSWVGVLGAGFRAEAAALYLFSYYLGSSVIGVTGGVFYTRWGWGGVCLFVALLTVAGAVLAWRLARGVALANTAAVLSR